MQPNRESYIENVSSFDQIGTNLHVHTDFFWS